MHNQNQPGRLLNNRQQLAGGTRPVNMNNGGPQGQQGQYPGPGGQGYPQGGNYQGYQPQPQLNFLEVAKRNVRGRMPPAGQSGEQRGSVLGFSYDGQHPQGQYGTTYPGTRDELAFQEQRKQEALQIAMNDVSLVNNAIYNRSEIGGFYSAFLGGLNSIKMSNRNALKPDPYGEKVFNEIMNRQDIYFFVVNNLIIQLTGELALTSLDGRQMNPDGSDMRSAIMEVTGGIAHYIFIEWVYFHADRISVSNRIHPDIVNRLRIAENNYDYIVRRYELVGGEMPWPKGRVAEIFNAPDIDNDIYAMCVGSNGYYRPDDFRQPINQPQYSQQAHNQYPTVGDKRPYYDNPNQVSHHEPDQNYVKSLFDAIHPDSRQVTEKFDDHLVRTREERLRMAELDRQREAAAIEAAERDARRQAVLDYGRNMDMNEYDRIPLPISEFNWEHSYKFRVSDYFVELGDTGFWLADTFDSWHMLKHFNKTGTDQLVTRQDIESFNQDMVLVVKFDFQNKSVELKFVNVEGASYRGEPVAHYMRNPNDILPYMFEQDGEVKTSWTPIVVETKEFINPEDNSFRPLSEMVELKTQPNTLFGSTVVLSENDGDTISLLDGQLKAHDKEGKLDAFVLPTKMVGSLTVADGLDVNNVYTTFPMLVKGGQLNFSNAVDFFRTIRSRMVHFKNTNIEAMITVQLTNSLNRWLIEQRGYPETKSPGYLRLDNIFDDLEQFVDVLTKDDLPTLQAFSKILINDYMIGQFQIFETQKNVVDLYEKKAERSDDPTAMVTAKVMAETNIMIRRDAVFISVRTGRGPHASRVVLAKRSEQPMLHALVDEALTRCQKHYTVTPSILVRYETPAGNYIREASYSDFDRNTLVLRSLDKGEGLVRGIPPRIVD